MKSKKIINKSFLILFLLLISIPAFSQSAKELGKRAEDLYEKGYYQQAVTVAVNALNIKPTEKRAYRILLNAYARAINKMEEKIKEKEIELQTLTGDVAVKLADEIINDYKKIKNFQAQVENLPYEVNKTPFEFKTYYSNINKVKNTLSNSKEIKAEEFYAEGLRLYNLGKEENLIAAIQQFEKAVEYVNNYKETINYLAEIHYQLGILYYNIDDKKNHIKATYEFKAVISLISDYKDAQNYFDKAKEKATIIIAFLPIDKSAVSISQNLWIRQQVYEMETDIIKFISNVDIDYEMKKNNLLNNNAIEIGKQLNADYVIDCYITEYEFKNMYSTEACVDYPSIPLKCEYDYRETRGDCNGVAYLINVNTNERIDIYFSSNEYENKGWNYRWSGNLEYPGYDDLKRIWSHDKPYSEPPIISEYDFIKKSEKKVSENIIEQLNNPLWWIKK